MGRKGYFQANSSSQEEHCDIMVCWLHGTLPLLGGILFLGWMWWLNRGETTHVLMITKPIYLLCFFTFGSVETYRPLNSCVNCIKSLFLVSEVLCFLMEGWKVVLDFVGTSWLLASSQKSYSCPVSLLFPKCRENKLCLGGKTELITVTVYVQQFICWNSRVICRVCFKEKACLAINCTNKAFFF